MYIRNSILLCLFSSFHYLDISIDLFEITELGIQSPVHSSCPSYLRLRPCNCNVRGSVKAEGLPKIHACFQELLWCVNHKAPKKENLDPFCLLLLKMQTVNAFLPPRAPLPNITSGYFWYLLVYAVMPVWSMALYGYGSKEEVLEAP